MWSRFVLWFKGLPFPFLRLWGPFQARRLQLISAWPLCSTISFFPLQDLTARLSFHLLLFSRNELLIHQNPLGCRFYFFWQLLLGLVFRPGLSYLFVSQNAVILCALFSTTDSASWIYHFVIWSNFNFLHNSLWNTFLNQSCLDGYSFYASLLRSLISWLTVSSLSSYSLHLLFFFGILFYSFESFWHEDQLKVFHWSLSDSKYPQVSRTLLSILVDLKSAVVWMVSTRVLISDSSSPIARHLVTVL